VPDSPASSQRPFDFADLGRPRPKSVRTLPVVPEADASGQLEELGADDIYESDDIDALEAAAAGFSSFEVEAAEPYVAPEVAAPAPEPSGFEVGDVGAFDDAEVEGLAAPALAAKPLPTTLMGMPAAPVTSPLALEDPEENVIISEPAPTTARTPFASQPAQPVVEKTLEIRGNDMAKVAAAAAKLSSEPDQTEVLVRSAMPAALQNVRGRNPSSVAPVAMDVAQRSAMPRIPPMARVPSIQMPARAVAARPATGLSGLAIGGMAAAAILLVSVVGIGGYAASRTLSAKTDAVEATPSDTAAAGEAATAAAAAAGIATPNQAASPAAGDPAGAASSPIDVSSLPSAPVPGAAPRGFTGKGSFAVTPPPLPVAVAAEPAAAAPVAAAPAPAAPAAPAVPIARSGGAPAAPVARSGGALAAPGGRSAPAGAPLPPPPSAPAVAAAPVAAAPVATTGVVHVDPNLRAVQVDGTFRHANDGTVVVACGTHRIKAGMKETQTVNVPCGGAVSL
jgi:hypothetical protein